MIHTVKISSAKPPRGYPTGTRQFNVKCSSCGYTTTIFGSAADGELSARSAARKHQKESQ